MLRVKAFLRWLLSASTVAFFWLMLAIFELAMENNVRLSLAALLCCIAIIGGTVFGRGSGW